MTPHEFVAKWRGVELKERSASQSHLNDLCALVGVAGPITADKASTWFAFQKGANKSSGGDGWADVWRRGCFAWEYKGPRKDLDKAFSQLLQYSVALENPPLLIVSDMDSIRIHTNWTNTVREVHGFTIDDLLDGADRARLKQAFTDPEAFRPSNTRQALTEETAREFAAIAQRLRDGGDGERGFGLWPPAAVRRLRSHMGRGGADRLRSPGDGAGTRAQPVFPGGGHGA